MLFRVLPWLIELPLVSVGCVVGTVHGVLGHEGDAVVERDRDAVEARLTGVEHAVAVEVVPHEVADRRRRRVPDVDDLSLDLGYATTETSVVLRLSVPAVTLYPAGTVAVLTVTV